MHLHAGDRRELLGLGKQRAHVVQMGQKRLRVAVAFPTHRLIALEAKAVSQLWLRQYKGCLETAASMKEPQEIQALAYLKLGNLKEARAAHQAIAKGSEESRLAQLGGGLIKLRDGNLSEALKKIEGSLAEDQLFAPSHMELARIYLALGDFKKAETYLNGYLQVDKHRGN